MSSIDVIAQRSRRASGHLYVFALPLARLPDFVPVPVVGQRSSGNRLLDTRHARDFGTYWSQNVKWSVPPLLLDTEVDLDPHFQVQVESGALEVGVLRLPEPAVSGLAILDGQHRVYGWSAVRSNARERAAVLEGRLRSRSYGVDDAAAEEVLRELADLARLSARLDQELVTVEVLDCIDGEEHKQWFFDIATNAKGITKSLTAAFDRRSAINRATIRLADEYPLLEGMVEREGARVGPASAELVSIAQLKPIVEAATLGIDGWIRRDLVDVVEDEEAVLETAASAFDALFDGFEALRDVAEGASAASALRERSLLGSVPVQRVLVAVFNRAAVSVRESRLVVDGGAADRITDFFREIAALMEGRLPDALWESGAFMSRTARAPGSRRQQIHSLFDAFWAIWLASAAHRSAGATRREHGALPGHGLRPDAVSSGSPPRSSALTSTAEAPGGTADPMGPVAAPRPRDTVADPEFTLSEADDDAPAQRVLTSGATADPVKDYLRQTARVALLSSEKEVELARSIEAGLLATEMLMSRFPDYQASTADLTTRRLVRDLQRLVREGRSAKAQLVEANLRLVVSIAKRYTGRGMPLLDLIQEGNIGLIRAVEKFDYALGHKFSTYATWWIRQAITRAMADQARTIRLPVHVVEVLNRVRSERRRSIEMGQEPSSEAIAQSVDLTVDKLVELMSHDRPVDSLDRPVAVPSWWTEGEWNGVTRTVPLGWWIVDDYAVDAADVVGTGFLRSLVSQMLGLLPARDAGIMSLRYGLLDGEPRTLDEIGKVYGVTRERIRQIEAKTLVKLSDPMFSNVLIEYAETRPQSSKAGSGSRSDEGPEASGKRSGVRDGHGREEAPGRSTSPQRATS